MMVGKESGFALIAALLAILILTAVGVLVFTVTTQDVRISSRMVGEKKAFFATEAGIHILAQGFDPTNLTDSTKYDKEVQVDSGTDPGSKYSIRSPEIPTVGPAGVAMPGYSIGGGQQYGAARFMSMVRGKNDGHRSAVQVETGVGFGPVEITTTYR